MFKCTECNGYGGNESVYSQGSGATEHEFWYDCDRCDGTGLTWRDWSVGETRYLIRHFFLTLIYDPTTVIEEEDIPF